MHNVYIVLNSHGELQQNCGKVDPADCEPSGSVDLTLEGQHKNWTMLSLAGRSLEILINQVERLSVNRAITLEREGYRAPIFVRIDPKARDEFTANLGDAFEPGTKSCAEWKKVDELKESPLELHPRFMRCQLAFGRFWAKKKPWDEPPSPPQQEEQPSQRN
jgi:hypothetical protein